MHIWLGNIISLVGCCMMVALGLVKSQRKVVLLQCVQFSIQAVANLLLGAVSGAICGVVGIARNLLFARFGTSSLWKAMFIIIQIVMTLILDGFGLLVWLPILSAAIFTWFMDVKSPITFKWMIICAQSLWIVYDLYYLNFVSLAFDVFTVLSNLCGIWILKKEE